MFHSIVLYFIFSAIFQVSINHIVFALLISVAVLPLSETETFPLFWGTSQRLTSRTSLLSLAHGFFGRGGTSRPLAGMIGRCFPFPNSAPQCWNSIKRLGMHPQSFWFVFMIRVSSSRDRVPSLSIPTTMRSIPRIAFVSELILFLDRDGTESRGRTDGPDAISS